jgi:hypothetical protein
MQTVTYRFDTADIVDHWRVQRRGNRAILVVRIVMLVFGVGYLASMWNMGVFDMPMPELLLSGGIGGAIALALVLLLVRYVPPAQARRVIRQQKSLLGDWTAAWDAQGIGFTSTNGQSRLAWGDFHKWRESSRSFLLFQSDVAYSAIPKRALTDMELVVLRDSLLGAVGPSR